MDSLLAKLERRFGKYAVEQLPLVIVGGMATAFVLGLMRPEFLAALDLDLAAVRRGQVWRLVTYLFLPRTSSPIWLAFSLYIVWLVGNALESEWGAFQFNVYYLLGMIGTTAAAWITGFSVGNTALHASLFLAFATLYPDFELRLFFVLPVKVKWMAWLLTVAGVVLFVISPWPWRAALIAAMGNYLLFFGPHLVQMARGRRLMIRQAARRDERAPAPSVSGMGARVCAICGAREDDGADIRVCSCEKCGGKTRNLCLEHARNH